jgi:hypothetical protein
MSTRQRLHVLSKEAVWEATRKIEMVDGSGFMCLAGKPGCGRRREK